MNIGFGFPFHEDGATIFCHESCVEPKAADLASDSTSGCPHCSSAMLYFELYLMQWLWYSCSLQEAHNSMSKAAEILRLECSGTTPRNESNVWGLVEYSRVQAEAEAEEGTYEGALSQLSLKPSHKTWYFLSFRPSVSSFRIPIFLENSGTESLVLSQFFSI